MKYVYFLSLAAFCFMLVYCTAARPEYVIGNDVPPENKASLIERAEKGDILFKIH